MTNNIKLSEIENAIFMLNKYEHETSSIKPLISILEALKGDPHNESLLVQLTETWRNLGVYQGAVLTHVPYFYTMIPDDIFGDDIK